MSASSTSSTLLAPISLAERVNIWDSWFGKFTDQICSHTVKNDPLYSTVDKQYNEVKSALSTLFDIPPIPEEEVRKLSDKYYVKGSGEDGADHKSDADGTDEDNAESDTDSSYLTDFIDDETDVDDTFSQLISPSLCIDETETDVETVDSDNTAQNGDCHEDSEHLGTGFSKIDSRIESLIAGVSMKAPTLHSDLKYTEPGQNQDDEVVNNTENISFSPILGGCKSLKSSGRKSRGRSVRRQESATQNFCFPSLKSVSAVKTPKRALGEENEIASPGVFESPVFSSTQINNVCGKSPVVQFHNLQDVRSTPKSSQLSLSKQYGKCGFTPNSQSTADRHGLPSQLPVLNASPESPLPKDSAKIDKRQGTPTFQGNGSAHNEGGENTQGVSTRRLTESTPIKQGTKNCFIKLTDLRNDRSSSNNPLVSQEGQLHAGLRPSTFSSSDIVESAVKQKPASCSKTFSDIAELVAAKRKPASSSKSFTCSSNGSVASAAKKQPASSSEIFTYSSTDVESAAKRKPASSPKSFISSSSHIVESSAANQNAASSSKSFTRSSSDIVESSVAKWKPTSRSKSFTCSSSDIAELAAAKRKPASSSKSFTCDVESAAKQKTAPCSKPLKFSSSNIIESAAKTKPASCSKTLIFSSRDIVESPVELQPKPARRFVLASISTPCFKFKKDGDFHS